MPVIKVIAGGFAKRCTVQERKIKITKFKIKYLSRKLEKWQKNK